MQCMLDQKVSNYGIPGTPVLIHVKLHNSGCETRHRYVRVLCTLVLFNCGACWPPFKALSNPGKRLHACHHAPHYWSQEHMHVILLSLYRWHFQQCGTPQQTHTGTLWLKLHIRDLLGKPLRQNVCTYQLAQFTIPFMWSKGYENSADKTTCRTSRATLHLVAQTSLWVYSVVSLHRIVCLFITTQPGGQLPERAYLFH